MRLLPAALRERIRPLLTVLKPQPKFSSLPPREKAHRVVASVSEATIACLRTQSSLWQGRRERDIAIKELGDNLAKTILPDGLTEEDMAMIEPWMVRSIVFNVANGYALGGLEAAIHDRFKQIETEEVPEVRELPNRSSGYTSRRAGPRRRV